MAGSVYEGKTFDEAVRKGLEALRLSRAEAVITTVEEGKGGFLGFGARPFRVSVARRPGGAIREPAERGGEERRGGRRSGREERPSRGERGGRGGREQAATGRSAERGGREERAGRGERSGRASREERGAREERGGRDESREREKQVQAAAPGRGRRDERGGREEERLPREERAPREEKVAREDRGGREERRERAPREERRPPPAQAAAPVPVPPSLPDEGDDDSPRKRRRRGRRGGRGRRRGGADEGAPMRTNEAPLSTNGAEMPHAEAAAEPVAPPVAQPSMRAVPEAQPERPLEPQPAVRASEPEEVAMAYDPAAGRVADEEAPSERRIPREHREGLGDRVRSPRHERRAGEESEGSSGAPDMNAEELAATSRRLTDELLRAMGFEAKIAVRCEGNRVDVTVEVDRDDDLLNGRQGETRLALQHLLNRFLNKGDGSRYHLQLEVNDFWQQRETELADLARGLADQAVTSNAEVVSDFLNSQERRILHVTLKEDARVKTYSLGSGMVKRVAVAPAGFPERSEDDRAG